MLDDVEHCCRGNLELVVLESVFFQLLRNQVTDRNVVLFILCVTRDANNLHAIQQRWRNIEAVGRADEHDVREIEIDLEIVIGKRRVLLRVEYFE